MAISTFGTKFLLMFRNTAGGFGADNPPGAALKAVLLEMDTTFANLDPGQPTTFSLIFSSQPTTGDTITLTGTTPVSSTDVYQFITAAGAVTNDAYIGVAIAGTAALTAANLVLAVNGLQTASGITNIATTAPAQQNGTLYLFASTVTLPSQTVHFVSADSIGGTIIGAVPSIVPTESITAAADVWTMGAGVNVNTLGGRVASARASGGLTLTVTTAMLTPKKMWLSAPFTINGFSYQLRSATGAVKLPINDLVTIAADGKLYYSLVGGAGGDAANTDVASFQVW